MSETWISKGLCRLCHLTEGHFRSLEACYPTPEGKEEIYSALLRETFDIVLTPPTNPSTFSICGACEERLRDAALFKKQVLDCEERFNSFYLQDGCFKHEVKEEANNHTEGFFEQPLNILQEEEKDNASKFLEIVVPQSIPKSPSVHQNSLVADRKSQCRDEYQSKEKTKKISCSFCKKQFKNISLLLIHLKTHTGEISCLICTEYFYSNTDLIKHYGLEHGDGTKYPCTMCSKVFDKPTLLINHLKAHFGDEFKCTECEIEFVRKKDLKEHMTIHSVSKMPKTNAEKCEDYRKRDQEEKRRRTAARVRAHRLRKKLISNKIGTQKVALTSTERTRKWRAKKNQLLTEAPNLRAASNQVVDEEVITEDTVMDHDPLQTDGQLYSDPNSLNEIVPYNIVNQVCGNMYNPTQDYRNVKVEMNKQNSISNPTTQKNASTSTERLRKSRAKKKQLLTEAPNLRDASNQVVDEEVITEDTVTDHDPLQTGRDVDTNSSQLITDVTSHQADVNLDSSVPCRIRIKDLRELTKS